MGMSYKAATSTYKRRLYIADHAVQRLRERLPGDPGSLAHCGDDHLGNIIDEAIQVSMANGSFRLIGKNGPGAKCVMLAIPQATESMYALVRKNRDRHPEWAVVTLYTEKMVEENMANGRWAIEAPQASPVAAPLMAVPPTVVEAPGVIATTAATAVRLVTYRREGSTTLETAFYQHGELKQRLRELHTDPDVDPDSIQVWKEVKTKKRVEFDIED